MGGWSYGAFNLELWCLFLSIYSKVGLKPLNLREEGKECMTPVYNFLFFFSFGLDINIMLPFNDL